MSLILRERDVQFFFFPLYLISFFIFFLFLLTCDNDIKIPIPIIVERQARKDTYNHRGVLPRTTLGIFFNRGYLYKKSRVIYYMYRERIKILYRLTRDITPKCFSPFKTRIIHFNDLFQIPVIHLNTFFLFFTFLSSLPTPFCKIIDARLLLLLAYRIDQ